MYANHGRIEKYDHEFEGVNSRLDGLHAAILDVKLRHLEEWTERRRAIAKMYDEGLKDVVKTPTVLQDVRHVYHLYVVRVKNRDKVKKILEQKGIPTGIHYPIPVHKQQAYQYLGYRQGDFPNSEAYAEQILSLPMFPELTEKQIRYVTKTISEFGRCKGKAA